MYVGRVSLVSTTAETKIISVMECCFGETGCAGKCKYSLNTGLLAATHNFSDSSRGECNKSEIRRRLPYGNESPPRPERKYIRDRNMHAIRVGYSALL